ncbi:Uncharacterized protein FWK35_00006468 [Aphis craccivora]|uniref:Uncharacterized protein n=1 Tax=Aphis craccivora TaxID=307492 RepID=A0A6G0YBY0_APHCR|nr:Uncharacterized protein FWK35_00006468 [Aphis craccivora]
MKKYLTSSFSFSLSNFKEENIIVENDKTVGKDCLTWLNENSRAKIYNKFFRLKETFETPFYSVPISIMWKKLINTLENSCCIVDKTSNKLNYVYWANKNTNKLTGMNIKLSEGVSKREKVIKYVLSAFSFPMLPINYIEVTEVDNEKISIIQKYGKTYFTKTTTFYFNIERSGLIATKNVTTEILKKKTNITNALSSYVIEEQNLKASKKRELKLENIREEERRLNFLNETKTKNMKMLDDRAKGEALESKILEYFRIK